MLMAFGIKSAPFLEDNWCHHPLLKSAHATRNMGYRRFRALLSALHFADDAENPVAGQPNHDKVHKIKQLVTMISER